MSSLAVSYSFSCQLVPSRRFDLQLIVNFFRIQRKGLFKEMLEKLHHLTLWGFVRSIFALRVPT